ncbi:hypothetical protein CEK62_07590 [Alcanivorax sp. N3-2A]|nr:hypothetical protein CEK62_07590 [Alcanivorax sp. N3-2A]|tara:strand:- start:27324 stop:28994 length:1671 start_codon:yes stop_codon:yes gene_type:complete
MIGYRIRLATAVLLLGGAVCGHADRQYFSAYDTPTERTDKALYYLDLPLPENPDGPGYLYRAHYRDGDALYGEGVRVSADGDADGAWLGDWRYLYPNGQIKERGHSDAQGRLHGDHEIFYDNGQLERSVPYRHGERHGVEEMFDEQGAKLLEEPYQNGQRNGMHVSYYPENGQIYEQRRYRDGRYDQFYNRYDRDGNLIGHSDYTAPGVLESYSRNSDGELVRRQVYYHRDAQGHYRNDAPVWLYVIADHRDGQVSRVGLSYPNQDTRWRIDFTDGRVSGLRHTVDRVEQGRYVATDHRGVRREGRMKDGKPTGVWHQYRGERLIAEYHYQDGRRHGEGRERTGPDQQWWKYLHYQRGEYHGDWRTENEQGQVVESGHYKMGQRDGAWRTIKDDGVVHTGHYNNGEMDGEQIDRSADGELLARHVYRDGKRAGVWEEFNSDGEPTLKLRFENGQRQGEALLSAPYDSHLMQVRFRDDKLDGPWRKISREGYPLLTGAYQNGKRQGRFVEYDEHGRVQSIIPYRDDRREGEGYLRDRDGTLMPMRWHDNQRIDGPRR